MKTTQVTITDPVGLHARPAALFVKLASEFESDIQIRNLSDKGEWSNAKSILGILLAAVKQNDCIEIQADGSDEQAAVDQLASLVNSGFTLVH
jgi:phosphocarrier protein HPr